MRKNIKQIVALLAETMPIKEPVYEFGSLQVEGQQLFADLRPYFPGKKYVGTDMRPGPGVDRLLDLHSIDLPDGGVGTALCLDTLEHVEHPETAIKELYRVMAPQSALLISSSMDFPIHDHPYDFWRFTPDAIRSLLKPFDDSFVGWSGRAEFPHTVIGIACKGMAVPEAFKEGYGKWRAGDRFDLRNIVMLLTPPLLVPLLMRVHSSLAGVRAVRHRLLNGC